MAMGGAGGAIAPADMAALESILGMGMAGGGAPIPAPMAAPPAGPIPGMPSTDPAMIAQLRAADHAALDAAQDAAQAQASMMSTAAAGMGGAPMPMDPMAAAMGAPAMPMPGGELAGLMGAPMPLPGSAVGAPGGADMGSVESESITAMPGSAFAGDLGGY